MVHSSTKSTAWLMQLLLLTSWVCTVYPAFGGLGVGRLIPIHQLASSSPSSCDDGKAIDNDNDTLTLQELATRLRQVRAQTRSEFAANDQQSSQEAISAQLALCDQLLSTRFRNLSLSRCVAQPSSIHGMGLFATRPIAAEDLITLYPGDALLAWGEEFGGLPGPEGCALQAMYGQHVDASEQASPQCFLKKGNARDFEVVTGKRRSIVGDPSRRADPAYLGHIANDAACLVVGKYCDENELDIYKRASSEGANAAHLILEGCHYVTIATRDIEESEEILVSYGEGYWRGRGAHNSDTRSVDNTENPKKKKADKSGRGFGGK